MPIIVHYMDLEIIEQIKNIIYNKFGVISSNNIKCYSEKSFNFNAYNNDHYGGVLYRGNKKDFDYWIVKFIAYYFIWHCFESPSAYPLPNHIDIKHLSSDDVRSSIESFADLFTALPIMKKIGKILCAYSINKNGGNQNHIFVETSEYFYFIHLSGS